MPGEPSTESSEGRISSRLNTRIRRVVANRRIFPYLVLALLCVALLAGFVATLVDRKDFPSFGIAVWWAIVTLATVGYGDVVPTTPWGRVVGSAVILIGVTFLSFLTATVTSLFVSTEQEKKTDEQRALQAVREEESRELLLRLDARLAAIEAKLEQ